MSHAQPNGCWSAAWMEKPSSVAGAAHRIAHILIGSFSVYMQLLAALLRW